MANGSNLNQYINVKTVLTTCVIAILMFTANNLFAVRENTRVNEEQNKVICKAEDERKDLKKADADMKSDINKLVISITQLTGELNKTNALLNERMKKDKKD